MQRKVKRNSVPHRRAERGDTLWLSFFVVLALLAPLFIFWIGNYFNDVLSAPARSAPPTPQRQAAAPTATVPQKPTAEAAPAATAVVAATATPPIITATEPSASTAAEAVTSWKPKIAYQHYGDGYEKDIGALASRVDWLMMKYGMEDLAQKSRDKGYKGPLLKYMMTFQILGPGPYKNSSDTCKNNYTPTMNNVMWTDDFCEKVHVNEDWFLHNSKGERLYDKEKNWDGTVVYDYYMNPRAPGFREFWVEQVKRQGNQVWDGLFLDNVAVDFNYLRTAGDLEDGVIQEFRSNAEWQQAITGHLANIKANFPDLAIWGNMIEGPLTPDSWDPFLDYLDGFQEENFATNWVGQRSFTPQEWEAMLVRAEKAIAKGKRVLLYGQGEQKDKKRMRFSLASYLLVASGDDRAIFRYTYNSKYEKLWWYSEYDWDLGLPRGERYKEGDTWVRDYQCGRVTVDPAKRRGTIEQTTCTP